MTGELGMVAGTGMVQYFLNRSEAEFLGDTGFAGLWKAMRCVPEIAAIRAARAAPAEAARAAPAAAEGDPAQ